MSLRWHYGKELIYWRQYSIEANKSRPPQDQSYTEIKKLAFPAGVLHDGFLHSKDALKNHLKAFHDFQMCTKTAKGYKQSQRKPTPDPLVSRVEAGTSTVKMADGLREV